MTTFLLNMTCNHLYKSSYQNCLSSSTRRYGQTWSLDWLGTTFVSRVKNDAPVEACKYLILKLIESSVSKSCSTATSASTSKQRTVRLSSMSLSSGRPLLAEQLDTEMSLQPLLAPYSYLAGGRVSFLILVSSNTFLHATDIILRRTRPLLCPDTGEYV